MNTDRIRAVIFHGRPVWLILLVACCFAAVPRRLAADQLDKIHERGKLIWGGDAEGGGPYVYPDPKNPSVMIGFEVELADMLAQELGVKAEFQQGQWDTVPALLNRGDIDVALNGYELTPDRQREFFCTRPYYVYAIQLLVRRDSWIHSWDDLEVPTVTALGATARPVGQSPGRDETCASPRKDWSARRLGSGDLSQEPQARCGNRRLHRSNRLDDTNDQRRARRQPSKTIALPNSTPGNFPICAASVVRLVRATTSL